MTSQIKLMKTQKLSLNLAVGLIVLGCLLGTPMRANAGSTVIPGLIGSGLLGRLRAVTGRLILRTIPVSLFNNLLSVQPQTQIDLNVAATKILEQYQDVNMLFAVIQNKSLVENGEAPIVDINMLNAAIEDYNNIVMASSPEELQRLAQDPEFIRTGEMLKELRAVLNRR
jgi:hypothetical protein